MTAGVRRRLHPSSAVAPLDDDDLLGEIFLRLSQDPSSLPRASAICTRWRGLVSDPDFVRGFRLRHRRNAPILGCFITDLRAHTDRILRAHPRGPQPCPDRALLLAVPRRPPRPVEAPQLPPGHPAHLPPAPEEDPGVGPRHRRRAPPLRSPGLEFVMMEDDQIDGVVLRPAGSVHHFHFQVVLLHIDEHDRKRAVACVYSSETGAWGDLISALLPDEVPVDFSFMCAPAVLVGDSFHWLLTWGLPIILEFDLHRQILSVIPLPVDMFPVGRCQLNAMRADDGGGLGVLLMSGSNVHLWKRKIDCDGQASWVLTRTIELDRLLSLNSEHKQSIWMLGFAEYNNVVLVWSLDGCWPLHDSA